MPFVRCSRDKRGYEYIYLMHASGRRGKTSKPRLLYWFRSPPGVKVGREPFDDVVKSTLEAQHPGVVFDWKKLSVIPLPPPDVGHWRERRRLERATKQARRGEAPPAPAAAADAKVEDEEDLQLIEEQILADEPSLEERLETLVPVDESVDEESADLGETLEPSSEAASISAEAASTSAPQAPGQQRPAGARRRRRRGGRRRRGRPESAPLSADGAPIQSVESSPADNSSAEPSKSAQDSSKEE